MTTGEVADDAACFTNQQLACREIPRAQTDFKETVNTTRSDVSQIQRRRTGTTEVCTFVKQFADDVDVGSGVLFCFEREAGRQNSTVEIASGAAAQTVAVQLCALTAVAVNSSLRIGSYTTATSVRPLIRTAIDTAKCGRRLIKLVVPSSGSITH